MILRVSLVSALVMGAFVGPAAPSFASIGLPVPVATATPPGNALFGLYPGSNSANTDDASDLTETVLAPQIPAADHLDLNYVPDLARWQGRNNDIINIYSTWGASGNLFGYQLPTIWDTDHAVPMISWGQNGAFSNQDIVNGTYDNYLKVFAAQLKSFLGTSRRVYLRFDWEANGNWESWAPTASASDCAGLATQEALFVAMWRHVHDVLTAAGGFTPAQVAWVFSVNAMGNISDWNPPPNCPNGASDVTRHIYPGDAYVDWVGMDGYSRPGQGSWTPSAIFGPMVSELRSITSKPLSINEVSASTQQFPNGPATPPTVEQTAAWKGAWIASYFSYIESVGAKMSLWFNEDGWSEDNAIFSQVTALDPASRGDCTYASGGNTYNTFCEYASAVSSSYFTAPDLLNPGLLTTSQFLGL